MMNSAHVTGKEANWFANWRISIVWLAPENQQLAAITNYHHRISPVFKSIHDEIWCSRRFPIKIHCAAPPPMGLLSAPRPPSPSKPLAKHPSWAGWAPWLEGGRGEAPTMTCQSNRKRSKIKIFRKNFYFPDLPENSCSTGKMADWHNFLSVSFFDVFRESRPWLQWSCMWSFHYCFQDFSKWALRSARWCHPRQTEMCCCALHMQAFAGWKR